MSSSNGLVKPELSTGVAFAARLSRLKRSRCERSYKLDDPHIDCGLGCRTCLIRFPVGLASICA